MEREGGDKEVIGR